ncbi:MAG: hypothetical protein ACR2QF_04815 [Geminicoccaceae bacterium]
MGRLPIRQFAVYEKRELDPYYSDKELFTPKDGLNFWRKWLHDFCFYFLRKINARAEKPMHVVTYRSPIEPSEKLSSHIFNAASRSGIYAGNTRSVLIGPDTFNELMNEARIDRTTAIAMNFEASLAVQDRREIFGLDMHIIPNMEGFVVLPGVIHGDGRYSEEEMGRHDVRVGSRSLYEEALMPPGNGPIQM